MLNQSRYSTPSRRQTWKQIIILLNLLFGLLVFTSCVQAQEGANDPVASVELPEYVSVWRDAVTTGSETITCTDKNGNPVSNASVSVTIGAPGTFSPAGTGSSTTGTTDANGQLQLTVQSIDLSPDDAGVTITATCEGKSNTGEVYFKGALRILDGGVDVTKKTTQCNVGEPQSLQAQILSGVSITRATWSASGATPINNWDGTGPASVTTPFPPNSDSEPMVTLYLTTTGNDTVTLSASDSGASGTATTSFTVSEPTDFSFAANQLAVVDGNFAVGIGSLDPNSPTSGIYFTGSGGTGGILSTAQIVTSNTWTVTDNKGPHNLTKPHLPGLDNSFPYPDPNSPGVTNDTPEQSYAGTSLPLTEINETNFSATMYLMWTSSKARSIAIPVESIDWTWYADSTFDPKTGKPLSLSGSEANPSITGTAVNSGVLTWTQTSHNSDHGVAVP